MQRGSLPGRSLLSNVVDIDESMVTTALCHEEGAALFFDFEAAFPSVLHSFLIGVLRHIGLPPPLVHFLAALYTNNICSLVLGGTRFPGLHLLSGIRQGCPLSPLCFAVAADLLLRRLQRVLPDATIRAYADDLAVVLLAGQSAFPLLVTIFEEYALICWTTTQHAQDSVGSPAPRGPGSHRRRTQEPHPACLEEHIGRIQGQMPWVLLGPRGPERGHTAYDEPLAKYRQRAKDWGAAGGGLALSTLTYAVYILRVILFVAQLDGLPTNWASVEQAALHNLLPGPASWFTVDAARGLQCLGLPKGFVGLSNFHKAIQFRVATTEGASQGGLDVIHRARSLTERLTQCTRAPSYRVRPPGTHGFRPPTYLFQLRDAIHHLRFAGGHQADPGGRTRRSHPLPIRAGNEAVDSPPLAKHRLEEALSGLPPHGSPLHGKAARPMAVGYLSSCQS